MKNALVAKAVFNELTLGEVFKYFEGKIESLHVYCEDTGVDFFSQDWAITKPVHGRGLSQHLELYGPYETDFQFDLKTKVKIHQNELEFKDENKTFFLTLFQKIDFSSLLES